MSGTRPITVPEASPRGSQREDAFLETIATVRSYRELPQDWDRYGGAPALDRPIEFAVLLLEQLNRAPDVPLPTACPISRGVYLEWRLGKSLLYFEADSESVLTHTRHPDGSETTEDVSFDAEAATRIVLKFVASGS